jgi:2-haloacid dehalogenase
MNRRTFLAGSTAISSGVSLRRAGLRHLFDHVISTDRIRSFKPDPLAYRLGVEVTGLRREEILFVAHAGWDVAGARWFGYRTFWNNRPGAADERLDAAPEARGATLLDLRDHLDREKMSPRRD